MFFQKYVTRSKQYPSIGEVIVSSMTALSSQKEKETAKFADIFLQLEVGSHRLFQTQGIKNLIENAYQESKAVLKQYEPMFRDEK
jgi:hypothetical protein